MLGTMAVARALDMQIMLSCMVESSLGVTAAAHIAPLADYADLDGPLLITNDPFVGLRYEGAHHSIAVVVCGDPRPAPARILRFSRLQRRRRPTSARPAHSDRRAGLAAVIGAATLRGRESPHP